MVRTKKRESEIKRKSKDVTSMVAYGHERWSLVSLVIVVWIDLRGGMSKAKRATTWSGSVGEE